MLKNYTNINMKHYLYSYNMHIFTLRASDLFLTIVAQGRRKHFIKYIYVYSYVMKTIQQNHPPHHHNGFGATCPLGTASGGVHALLVLEPTECSASTRLGAENILIKTEIDSCQTECSTYSTCIICVTVYVLCSLLCAF